MSDSNGGGLAQAPQSGVLFLVKFVGQQGLQLLDGFVRILAAGLHDQFAAWTCCQHHESHDAFPIDPFAVLLHKNVRIELAGSAYEHGCRSGVYAHFVLDNQLLCD
jgi:hypothetical protein